MTGPDTTSESSDPFSTSLRRATARHHEEAESAPFVDALLAGRLDLSAFSALAAQLHVVYAALESAADRWRDDRVAGPFLIDGLARVPALRADLQQLLGPRWERSVSVLPTTRAYADRIAATDTSGRFVAHHYIRYLGDVSGGQVIAAAMRRQHGDLAGIRFYDFTALYAGPHRNPAEFRRHYRSLLDRADWTATERADLIAEAGVAFRHNRMIFEDLGGAAGLNAA